MQKAFTLVFQIFYLGDIWYIDVTQILMLWYKQYHPALRAYIYHNNT